MATLEQLISKAERDPDSLTPEERARLREARADRMLGRETPGTQIDVPGAPVRPQGLGAQFQQALTDMPGQVARTAITPGAIPAFLGENALSPLASMFAGEVPEGMEQTPELFGFSPEHLMGVGEAEMSPMERARVRAGFFLNRRPEARMDILANTLGDRVSFDEDALGNVLVEIGESGPAYLNRPGFSRADVQRLGDDMLAFVPTGRVANLLGRAASQSPTFAGRMGAGAGAAGATGLFGAGTEAGMQGLSGVFGSEQGVDPADVALAGAFSTAGELPFAAMRTFRPEARQVIQQADQLGIGLAQSPRNQVLQTRLAAQQMAPGSPAQAGHGRAAPRGAALEDLQPALQRQRETERQAAGALFDTAREQGRSARIGQGQVGELNQRVRTRLSEGQFDLPPTGRTRQLLSELDQMSTPPQGVDPANVQLRVNSLENWRRKARKRRDVAARSNPEEAQALREAINEYDVWMDERFVNDMISGDPQAVQSWRNAREGWRQYNERFNADDVIRKLHQSERLTPEEVRRMVLGGSQLPDNRPVARTIHRLDDLLGADSPQMRGVRAEVAADITEPLFRDTPDIQAFVQNYDRMMNRNRSMMEALYPDNLEDLHTAARLARGIARRRGAQIPDTADPAVERMLRFTSAYTVGHGIAQGGARQELARSFMDRMVREPLAGPAARREILREFLGYEPTQQLLPRGTGAVAGQATRGLMTEGGQTREPAGPQIQQDPATADRARINSLLNKAERNPQALTPEERQELRQAWQQQIQQAEQGAR